MREKVKEVPRDSTRLVYKMKTNLVIGFFSPLEWGYRAIFTLFLVVLQCKVGFHCWSKRAKSGLPKDEYSVIVS